MTKRGTTRRDFLKTGGRSVLFLGAASGLQRYGLFDAMAADGEDYRALVCVFLFGGNDANNMVVPLDSTSFNAYGRLRGAVALPASRLLEVEASGGRSFGFHESMSGIETLYRERRAAVVANLGTLVQPTTREQYQNRTVPLPEQLYSHENQQEQMQSGMTGSAGSGWGGRAADRVQHLNGDTGFPPSLSMSGSALFCLGEQIPSAGLGGDNSLELAGLNPPNPQDAEIRRAAHQQILEMDSGLRLIQASNAVRQKAADLNRLLRETEPTTPLDTPFPDSGLGQQLLEATRFIRLRDTFELRRQVFFCSIGGFDTHSGQDDQQASLLGQVSEAITAFYRATEELGLAAQITTFTESDFSRTFDPSNDGTDHGWGSHHLVVGGSVQGGDLYGRFPQFELQGPDDSGSRGVWIPSLSLAQYGATLARWFGVADDQLPLVFPDLPNFTPTTLPLF